MINLDLIEFTSEKDVQLYRSYLDKIDPHNPFYRYELLNVNTNNELDLKCFVLFKDGIPLVLMPFYLKPITLNDKPTQYFDATSPWGYMGPLYAENGRSTLPIFWRSVDAWYRKNDVIAEFIRFNFSGNHENYTGVVLHTLSNIRGRIQDQETIWSNFKRSVRKNYRTALKNDLRFEIFHDAISEAQIKEFYKIYGQTMDRHVADSSYYRSLDYFISFINKNPEHCAIATVFTPQGKPISTELLLLSDDIAYSFMGGTDSEHFASRPNDLLKIETINWARSMGYKFYILGGGLSDGDSLYQYKKKFFPLDKEIVFYTGRKILDQNIYDSITEQVLGEQQHVNADLSTGFFPLYRTH